MMRVIYDGQRKEHIPNSSSQWYGSDSELNYRKYLKKHNDKNLPEKYQLTGEWEYSFNSDGFRGEEINPNADKTLMVVGDSFAFGTGLKWEQTWSFLLKGLLQSESWGEDINLVNLSQGGASNDYICRTTIKNIGLIKPDVLIVYFSFISRTEFPHESRSSIYHLVPNVIGMTREDEEIYEAYYSYYNDKVGFINWVKNALLIQAFCKNMEIPVLFCSPDYRENVRSPIIMQDPLCKSYIGLLEQGLFSDFSLFDKKFFVDYARDCSHPGPKSNEVFAQEIYQELLSKDSL